LLGAAGGRGREWQIDWHSRSRRLRTSFTAPRLARHEPDGSLEARAQHREGGWQLRPRSPMAEDGDE